MTLHFHWQISGLLDRWESCMYMYIHAYIYVLHIYVYIHLTYIYMLTCIYIHL